ncbi:hypothetical protein E2C01_082953 [Portunus trituberculatus]|uniref:Uncharacterized protein n=1 Tax=Portunus trituberculatus TaxID=210409 RepID=A0A5B7J0N1_PORTR|nr:hypothetical protein [Portunus trituberculatus]
MQSGPSLKDYTGR